MVALEVVFYLFRRLLTLTDSSSMTLDFFQDHVNMLNNMDPHKTISHD